MDQSENGPPDRRSNQATEHEAQPQGARTRTDLVLLDRSGFYQQEHNPTDQRECSNDGRDEVALGGFDSQPEELNGLTGGGEGDARIGEDYDA